jgi:lipoprotein-anchoring transpeptidase ErfK/SrfK
VTRRARTTLLRRASAAVVLAGAAGLAAITLVPQPFSPAASSAAPAGASPLDVPIPRTPSFTPGKPRLLARASVHRWAPVLESVEARQAPRADAPVVGAVPARTPEGTENIVVVLGSAVDASGQLWIHVRLAVLPNNSTGWVPRSALGGYATVRTRLAVDLDELTATLYRDGRAIFAAPVGVGAAQWPTPRGEFYIRNRLSGFTDPVYGPLAFGTSARSSVLTDWPAGGFIGIHGTNRPDLLPGRVSHGCIRLRNEDILTLARLMPIGTPVTVS